MEPDDAIIFETVLDVVARYGMKRTTMAELAKGAGVSRQTLYDRFGDKDGIMSATIAHWGSRIEADLRIAFAKHATLADKLDAYFTIAVWPTFEAMQNMPDAADFEKGMGAASTAASARLSLGKQEILAEMLKAHLPPGGPSAKEIATFFEQSSSRAKMTDTCPQSLERFLAVLKASVLALAQPG